MSGMSGEGPGGHCGQNAVLGGGEGEGRGQPTVSSWVGAHLVGPGSIDWL